MVTHFLLVYVDPQPRIRIRPNVHNFAKSGLGVAQKNWSRHSYSIKVSVHISENLEGALFFTIFHH